jgi:hypothetical protein
MADQSLSTAAKKLKKKAGDVVKHLQGPFKRPNSVNNAASSQSNLTRVSGTSESSALGDYDPVLGGSTEPTASSKYIDFILVLSTTTWPPDDRDILMMPLIPTVTATVQPSVASHQLIPGSFSTTVISAITQSPPQQLSFPSAMSPLSTVTLLDSDAETSYLPIGHVFPDNSNSSRSSTQTIPLSIKASSAALSAPVSSTLQNDSDVYSTILSPDDSTERQSRATCLLNSTFYEGVKTAIITVWSAADCFPPLKSVAGGLLAIVDVLEVCDLRVVYLKTVDRLLSQTTSQNQDDRAEMVDKLTKIVELLETHQKSTTTLSAPFVGRVQRFKRYVNVRPCFCSVLITTTACWKPKLASLKNRCGGRDLSEWSMEKATLEKSPRFIVYYRRHLMYSL